MVTDIIPRLPALDLEVTERFYKDYLNCTTASKVEDYLIMGLGNVEVHFYKDDNVPLDQNQSMVYLRVVEKIDEIYQNMVEKGVNLAVLGEIEEKKWGMKEFSILDPNNNLLTFGQGLN
jgi:uncharacterized glyoxalase superfamily protein PhnB